MEQILQAIFGYHGDNAPQHFSRMNYFPNHPYSYDDFISPTLAMGVRRLPAQTGLQKARCASDEENKIKAVMVGEIFNTQEFDINSGPDKKCRDTDIIVRLYKKYGLDMFKKLDGLYTIALWDGRDHKMIVTVDRFGGIQRCYFTANQNFFAFSSSVKHLLALPGYDRAVNPDTLVSFFTSGHIIPPETCFHNILQVPPGYAAVYRNGEHQLLLVDDFQFSKDKNAGCEKFYHVFKESVRSRLGSDKKSGFLLSGGLDSSCNLAMASEIAGKGLTTITAKIAHGNLDESHFAETISNHCRTDHHEILPDMERALSPLPQIVFYFEEPFMDTSAVPVYHVFKAARDISDVIISGDGPDHLFGRHYPLAARRRFFRSLFFLTYFPYFLGNPGKNGLDDRVYAGLQKIWRIGFAPLPQAYIDRYMQPTWHTMGPKQMRPFFGPALQKLLPQKIEPMLAVTGKLNWFDALTMVDCHIDGSFGVFEKIGRLANGFDLIAREPYLQRRVTDFIFSLSRQNRVGGGFFELMQTKGEKKYFLRKAIGEKLLPAQTLKKQKAGFQSPTDHWIRQALGQKQPRDVICPELLEKEYFNPEFLTRIFNEHKSGKRQWGRLIYNLIFTDIWYRTFILRDGKKSLGVSLQQLWA